MIQIIGSERCSSVGMLKCLYRLNLYLKFIKKLSCYITWITQYSNDSSHRKNNRGNWNPEKGWSEAAQAALDEAKKTVNGITGLELVDKTAEIDPASGKITEYKVGVKIAIGVEHQ
jgi:flavin-binding protein dodecin